MKLVGKQVDLYLTEEGLDVLRNAQAPFFAGAPAQAEIADSDDLGLWVRVVRDQSSRDLLVRWEFILTIDKAFENSNVVGLTGRKDLG